MWGTRAWPLAAAAASELQSACVMAVAGCRLVCMCLLERCLPVFAKKTGNKLLFAHALPLAPDSPACPASTLPPLPRTAKQVLEAAGAEGRLGQPGAGAAVLYGHTDSLFCCMPHVSCDLA